MLALATYWDQGRLALDFHWELYPQAELVRDGEHAFDEPDSDLEDRANLIWPVAAVLPVVPLTAVGPDAADWIATAFVLATLVATLFVVGVRDWRIYGLSLMFPLCSTPCRRRTRRSPSRSSSRSRGSIATAGRLPAPPSASASR